MLLQASGWRLSVPTCLSHAGWRLYHSSACDFYCHYYFYRVNHIWCRFKDVLASKLFQANGRSITINYIRQEVVVQWCYCHSLLNLVGYRRIRFVTLLRNCLSGPLICQTVAVSVANYQTDPLESLYGLRREVSKVFW